MIQKMKLLYKIEEMLLDNQTLIKIIKAYFEDEVTNKDERKTALDGLNLLLFKQKQVLNLIKNNYHNRI